MGRALKMSWEGPPNFRWVKMHKGVRYRVSCDELGAPRTKADSYQAANLWWEHKLVEIGAAPAVPERQEALAEIERKITWAATHDPDLLQGLKRTKALIETEAPGELVPDDGATIEQNIASLRALGAFVHDDLDPEVLQHFFGDRRLWEDRLKRANVVERQRTVGHNLDQFLSEQRHQQKPATHKELSAYLRKLTENSTVWTAETEAATINEQTVAKHLSWLTSKNYGWRRHNKLLGFFRRFVAWLWHQKQIDDLPRNLKLKEHRKKRIHKAVKRHNTIHDVLEKLPDTFRLWALLGLNCGMTNADLGQTTWGQIDQINETTWLLTRRRAKTGDNPNSPTVTYKLWPETIELLKRLPTRKGLLFLRPGGGTYYQSKYTDKGKAITRDHFSEEWRSLDPKPSMTLKEFRSAGSTALKNKKEYREYVDYFLGHVPHKVSDVSYAAEADNPFFEALDFIRQVVLQNKETQDTEIEEPTN